MEYVCFIIIYIISGICLFEISRSKIFLLLCLLKIFDIMGPPQIIKEYVVKKMKNYAKKHTNINNMKTTPNAIYLLIPHGATFFPALRLSLLMNIEYPIYIINKWFLLIPGFVGGIKFFGNFVKTERGNVKTVILQNNRPIIIYPNGPKEVLYNSSYSKRRILKIKDKILKYLLNSKKDIYVIKIKNESKCYYFNKYVIKFYKFINKFVNVGIPFPLPYFSGEKLRMCISNKIDTSKITDIEVLRRDILYKTIV